MSLLYSDFCATFSNAFLKFKWCISQNTAESRTLFFLLKFLYGQASQRHLAAGRKESGGLLSLPRPQAFQICLCDIAACASAGRLFCQELAVLWRKEPYFKRYYRPSVLLKETEAVVLGLPPVKTGFGVALESRRSETSDPSFLHHFLVLQFYLIPTPLGTL